MQSPRQSCVSLVVLVLSACAPPDSQAVAARRIAELRELARPAQERLAQGPASDELRARLSTLDLRLKKLANSGARPEFPVLTDATLALPFAEYGAWLERCMPVLDVWLQAEPCGTPPGDALDGSEDWMPLRYRVEVRLQRGERVANDIPRLVHMRNWSQLLAWRAYFQARISDPGSEPWSLGSEQILASVLPLAAAFDDGSILGMHVRLEAELHTLRAARALLRKHCITATALRQVLDPLLVASASVEGIHVIEGSLGQACDALELSSDATDELVDYEGAEAALRWARLPAADFFRELERSGLPEPGGFEARAVSSLALLHRHRSILTLFRVGLAIEEFRERTATLPTNLGEIAASFPNGMPLDPLSGEPFAWLRAGGRLGPVTGPDGEHLDWPEAVEQLLAWDF